MDEDERQRRANEAEYSVALLMLVSLESQHGDPKHIKRFDQRLVRLRTQLTSEEVAQAEKVVNKVDRTAKALLAGRA